MVIHTTKTLVTPDGLTLFYRDFTPETNTKGTILCLPGLTRNSKDFIALAEHFSVQGWRLICPDMRGRGRSGDDLHPENYNIFVENRDILQLLKHENISKAVFLGTSRGGLQTMILALSAKHRPLIQAVILNDIGISIDPQALYAIGNGQLNRDYPSFDAALQALKKRDGGRTLADDETWATFTRCTFIAEGDHCYRDYDPHLLSGLRKNHGSWIHKFKFWLFTKYLKKGFLQLKEKPVLVIRGENSPILLETTLEIMKTLHPRLDTLTVANRGHTPLLDEPESLTALHDFLGKL